ncbi:tripartite tricarboxylate transporter substrate-binding protein [Zwartia sp.]|uniref:tripartite tricarboxylate transporter substrate-binding protein n=1 Tax=Zwartia sp. TaxID=2978004 RepID=UPI0027224643|nr:tripartite tricarboxylate transporter substrate-binding protein [Zwartia sp.]MDO9024228.1 tripartite tricarboxylate transporter substrate-binding protein [Zwartia sp.]
MKTALLRTLCASLLVAAGSAPAIAQDYPARSITMVMPYAPGGPGDTITRLFAAAMQKNLGQQIIVDNPAGASGSIGTARVARSAPDGYTLLMTHISHATNPMMIKNLSYSPVTDFEPVGLATVGPMVLVARKDFPPANTKEFVDYVKKNQDKISMGNAGVGSASHLCSLMFMEALGVKINSIPYKGTAPAMNDLLGGQIDILCDQTTSTMGHIKGGRVKPYAVAGTKRIDSLPDLPALSEAGVKDFDLSIWFGIYAPKGTPKPVIEKLSASLQKAVQDPEVKARLDSIGTAPVSPDLAVPEKLRDHLKREINTLGPLLEKAGIQAN